MVNFKEINKKIFISIFLIFIIGIFIYCRYLVVSSRSQILLEKINKEVLLLGVIDDEPDDLGFKKRVVVDIEKIQIGKDVVPINPICDFWCICNPLNFFKKDFRKNKIRVMVNCDNNFSISISSLAANCDIGSKIKFHGKITLPEITEDFDSDLFLLARGVQFEMKNAKIISWEEGGFYSYKKTSMSYEHKLKRVLFNFRNLIVENIRRVLPNRDEFALGSGILITGKGEMSKESLEHFKRAGLIHMVVLSGFNVSIVSQVIISFFSFLPNILSGIFGTIGIILFCVMVGGGATVVRSLLMSLIGIYSRIFNIGHTALTATLMAGLLMIIFNPLILIGDPSFQLSFACTLGLVLLGNSSSRFFKFLPKAFGLRETVSSFFATQFFSMPLLLKFSGALSVYGIFANLAVVPFIPLAMLLVFCSGILCFINVDIAMLFGLVSHFILAYFMTVVRYISASENALWELGKASNYFIIGWYIIVIPISAFLYKKFKDNSSD